MTDDSSPIERIEAYHEGKLDEAQRKDFEIQLLVDLQLQQENETYLRVRQAFRDRKEKEIRERLQQIDEKMDRHRSKRIVNFNRGWKIAAVFLLFLVGGWVLKTTIVSSSLSVDRLLPDEPGLPVLMGAGTDHKEFDQAMSEFQSGQFSKAAGHFDVLYQVNPENDTLAYFLALALLRKEQPEAALPLFVKVAGGNSTFAEESFTPFQAKSSYYLAVADYLLSHDAEKFKTSLRQFASSPDHPLSAFSAQVLLQLESR